MAVVSVSKWRCDRCGHTEEYNDGALPFGWISLMARFGASMIRDRQVKNQAHATVDPLHICNECAFDFLGMSTFPKTTPEVEQPLHFFDPTSPIMANQDTAGHAWRYWVKRGLEEKKEAFARACQPVDNVNKLTCGCHGDRCLGHAIGD